MDASVDPVGGAASALLDPSVPESWLHMIDARCVERLDRLATTHDAKVVITSSWRLLLTVETIAHLLRQKGFTGEVVGATTTAQGLVPDGVTERGHEIAHWLANAAVEVESFVILDDATDMAHLADRHVLTSIATGLTDDDVDAAGAILSPTKA